VCEQNIIDFASNIITQSNDQGVSVNYYFIMSVRKDTSIAFTNHRHIMLMVSMACPVVGVVKGRVCDKLF